MTSEKLALYYLAKYTNHELLIDGLILTNQLGSWEKTKKRKRSMSLKIIRVKIFYAIIFGILPIFPLLGYFQIADYLINSLISVEIIIFHGSLYFGLFFMLQFFNFFLMGMLETGMIMSGRIFQWFETLPIPREKLKRIVFVTIFRSFDIPILVIILTFPIVLFLGTSNILIFLMSIGISVLNVMFSLNILILVGGRINRVLDVNEINSRRSYTIRLFNIISYIIITLGSMYLIQWAFGSIDRFFRLFLHIQNPEMTNMFLSGIPYPFNSSYLILNLIVKDRTPLGLWVSSIIGLIIYILIIWGLYVVVLKQLEKLTFSKFRSSKDKKISKKGKKKIKVQIKPCSPKRAYLRKDLILITHDLKTFLAIVTSVILAFIYMFYFNQGSIGVPLYIVSVIYNNWIGMLIFHPILSIMLIYSILSLEDSGQSVLTALPIIPEQQARTKLFLIFTIQTIATFLPNLMFINDPNSQGILIATFVALPFIWLFLLLIFELKLMFFGKIGEHYVLREVNATNKLFKWVLIFCLQYIISFWIISFVFMFFIFRNFVGMIWFIVLVGVSLLVFVLMIYNKIFPSKRKREKLVFNEEKMVYEEMTPEPMIIQNPTILCSHPWASILLLLFLYYIFYQISMFNVMASPSFYTGDRFFFFGYVQSSIQLILSNLIFISLLLIIVPFFLGLPYGRQTIKDYTISIGLGWTISLLRGIIWAASLIISVLILDLLLSIQFSIYLIGTEFYIYEFITFLSTITFFFWQEVLFRGIILRILLIRYSKALSIILNAFIFWIWTSFLLWFPLISSGIFLLFGFISAYLTTKTNSLLLSFVLVIFLSGMYWGFYYF
ncbi:MAG: CPBP family intramembrane glutamic endopeptidase [Promethearchaeota archaeon]